MKKALAVASLLSVSLAAFSAAAKAQDMALPFDLAEAGQPLPSSPISQGVVDQTSFSGYEEEIQPSRIAATAFVAYFSEPLEYNLSEGKEFPVMLGVAQPFALTGDVLIPANSFVSARVVPVEGGVQIVANSILTNGQAIPVNAISPLIPSETIVFEGQSSPSGGVNTYSRGGAAVSCVLSGLFGGNCSNRAMETGISAGSLLGLALGANRPQSQAIEIVRFRQDSLHIFSFSSVN